MFIGFIGLFSLVLLNVLYVCIWFVYSLHTESYHLNPWSCHIQSSFNGSVFLGCFAGNQQVFPMWKTSIQAILGDVAVRSHHDLSNNAKICAHSLIHVGVFENVLDHQVMAITIRKIVLYHENLVAFPLHVQTNPYIILPYGTGPHIIL